MLKKIFLTAIFTLFVISSFSNGEIIFECSKVTDRNWWNPSDWFKGNYEDGGEYWESHFVGDDLIISHHIICWGTGGFVCASCSVHSDPNHPEITQSFLDGSCTMMENYVILQFNSGNYVGSQSFDTYFGGIPVYRNVTWEADSTSIPPHFNYNMNILPSY